MSLESFIARAGRLLHISEWKLNDKGALDMPEEKLIELTDIYGKDLVDRLESDLKSQQTETQPEVKHNTNKMTDSENKWKNICSHLGIESLEMSDEGVYLGAEQLDSLEAAFASQKTATDTATAAQTKAESDLAAANTARQKADDSLAEVVKALDDLDASVKEGNDLQAKVEAVRQVLAARPAVAPTGTQRKKDGGTAATGADPVNAYVNEIF